MCEDNATKVVWRCLTTSCTIGTEHCQTFLVVRVNADGQRVNQLAVEDTAGVGCESIEVAIVQLPQSYIAVSYTCDK